LVNRCAEPTEGDGGEWIGADLVGSRGGDYTGGAHGPLPPIKAWGCGPRPGSVSALAGALCLRAHHRYRPRLCQEKNTKPLVQSWIDRSDGCVGYQAASMLMPWGHSVDASPSPTSCPPRSALPIARSAALADGPARPG